MWKYKKQETEKEAKLEVLKRSKYSLLKNEATLTEPQKEEKNGSSVCVMQWTGVIRDGTLI